MNSSGKGPLRTLDSLPARARALLGSPSTTSPVIVRLVELGMTPGTPVSVIRRAPFGEPIEIELRGTRLCLRRADAAAFGITHIDSDERSR